MYQDQEAFTQILEDFDVAAKFIGRRVFLGAMELDHADAFAAWLTDETVASGTRRSSDVMSSSVEDAFMEHALADPNTRAFSIYDRKMGRLIGQCSIHEIDWVHRTAMVGIFIGLAEYRGGGRGAEALSMLLHFGFDMLDLENIALRVLEFNEGAIKCYEKVGFVEWGRRHKSYFYDGERYDEIFMEMTRESWRDMMGDKESKE